MGGVTCKPPFTAVQWQELEKQAWIFKHLMAGIPDPQFLGLMSPLGSFSSLLGGLTSFRLASYQQLGDDLAVDVIEFAHGNHMTSSDLNESYSSPFKFKTVVYGQQEPQHPINELPLCNPDVMLASDQQLGDDLVVDVIEFAHGNHMTSSDLNESCLSPFKFKTVVYGQQEPQHPINELPLCNPDVMDTVPRAEQAEPSNPRERATEKRKVKNTGGLNLTLEDLRPHFGKPLAQVVKELGVGRSTIKRARERYGIDRWPSSKKYLKNPSLFEAAGTSHDNSNINIPPPDMSLPPTNAKIPPQPLINLMPESETVTVKAKYEDKIIKIKLCLSSTMNKLVEEVGRRLDLEKGSFELRYLDEDDDNILIACDDDLQLCFNDQRAMGRTTMEVFVQLILK